MRKSHIFLMIVVWFGFATYLVLKVTSGEAEEDQSLGLSQKIQAIEQKIQAQDEQIERLEAKMVEIEKLLAAVQQAPPPKPRSKATTKLQEHLNVTQELHIAEDVARSLPHPTQEHLQTIRRLHEMRHKADQAHMHPPIHIH